MKHTVTNLFTPIPKTIPEELFDTLLETEHCKLERILSLGQATPPGQWYDQAWGEWVLLLRGRAGLRFAGEEIQALGSGDYLWIPAHHRHRVEWTSSDEPAVWLAFHVNGPKHS